MIAEMLSQTETLRERTCMPECISVKKRRLAGVIMDAANADVRLQISKIRKEYSVNPLASAAILNR